MKKLVLLAFILVTLFACTKEKDNSAIGEIPKVQNPPNGSTDPINLGGCGGTASTDLIAGQHTVIGKIIVHTDGSTLWVTYQITKANWCMTGTHLSVKGTWEEIPQTGNGNPIPGQFEYKDNWNNIIGCTYTVDVSSFNQVSIAAHCDAVELSGINQSPIPGLAPGMIFQMNVTSNQQNSNIESYFHTNLFGNPIGSGVMPGFCVDKGTLIDGLTHTVITVDPYTLLPDQPNCMGIDRPENIDNVSYMINEFYLGSYNNAQGEELQVAIWTLLEPLGFDPGNSLNWDAGVVSNMLTDALNNGDGYIPGLCDYRFLILDGRCSDEVINNNDVFQTTTVIVPAQDCEVIGQETAWGYGPQFPGNNWGMYFNYCVK